MACLSDDAIALVWGAVQRVPEDLLDIAAAPPDRDWLERPEAEAASTWHSPSYLFTSYLRVAPHIRCGELSSGTPTP